MKLRLSVRTLLILPVVCVLLLVLADGAGWGVIADGARDQTFRFVVRDAATKRPLDGARIHFAELDNRPFFSHPGTDQFTDQTGSASITIRCPCSRRGGILTGNGAVFFPHWSLEVTRDGYQASGSLKFLDRFGHSQNIRDRSTPAITIELTKGGR